MGRYGILVLAALSLPAVARAQSGAELCGRIGTQQELNECTAIVSNRRVDATAAELCGRIGTNREIVDCARAVAGRAVSAEAVTLCGRIGTNREIVECARAVAGRWLDAGAVEGCGRVGTNSDIVRCARAIADKRYGSEELELCGRNGTNDGIVQCMQGAGRRRGPGAPAYAPRPVYAPAPPAYAPAPPPPPPAASSYADTPMSWFTLANRTAATPLVRLYVRNGDGAPWSANRLSRQLFPGQSTTVRLPEGTYDVCAEAPDGSSTFWNDFEIGEGGGAISLDRGREFPEVWGVRRPCRSY
jgi:hypothetical protein